MSLGTISGTVIGKQASLWQVALRVSTMLAKARGGVRETLDSALRAVEQAEEIGGTRVTVRLQTEDGDADVYQWEAHWPAMRQGGNRLREEFSIWPVMVTVEMRAAREEAPEVKLLASLLAQQFAQWTVVRTLEEQNGALREEMRIAEESVLLTKFMHRAKSLIIGRYGFSAEEAEEWLVGAAVRYEKPLLNVAQDIVTALSTPSLDIDAAA